MKKILLSLALASSLLLSCEDNISNDSSATKLTLSELRSDPGFADFPLNYNDYTLNQDFVADIKSNYNPDSDKIAIFVKPSCSCFNTQETLPHFVKALDSAGISSANVEVFAMLNKSAEHDYSAQIELNDLPEFHIIRNGEFTYSVLDSMDLDTILPIEYYTSEGLK